MKQSFPILEFDQQTEALIEPGMLHKRKIDMPERVVMCFFHDVVDAICRDENRPVLYNLSSEIGRNPVYLLETENGDRVAVMHPGVGAPLAAAFFEEAIALGGRKFIACGGAGVLDKDVGFGGIVVPDEAVRDEGTSYHYLPPSRTAAATPDAVNAIQHTLDQHDIPYQVGKTWTTDAIYRETRAKVDQRKAEGCLMVEMEAATFFAIAQFRDVQIGQLLYGGDDLTGEAWDHRNWQYGQRSTREKLFWLAVEAALAL